MDYQRAAEAFLLALKHRSGVTHKLNGFNQGENMVLASLAVPRLPSDIAQHYNISSARVATILNALEEKGYVTREISKEDRRKILVTTTEAGRLRAQEVKRRITDFLADVFEQMGEARTEAFIADSQLFFEIFEKKIREEKEGQHD